MMDPRTMAMQDAGARRLWRARRRHDRIDAVLRGAAAGWEVQYFRNDRLLAGRTYPTAAAARAEALARLRDLERAGWVPHW
jgi:hypothetical protein